MVSIRKERVIEVKPESAWAALCDWGGLGERLVPGFVVDVRLDDGDRILTFFNGMVVRERLVGLDEAHRRLAWSAIGEPFTHHNGAAQVQTNPDGTTSFVWISDLLPDDLEPEMDKMMDRGMDTIKQTLEAVQARSSEEA